MRYFSSATAAATLLSIAFAITPGYAESPQDRAALSGLSEVKVAFDLQNGNSGALLKQLEVIEETRQSLIKQGVKPDFVITFRGPATKLVQTDQSQIAAEDRENATKVAEKVSALKTAEGVASMEQCAIAVRLAGTKPGNVLPAIKVVGNGFISLMGYQAKGYGYIAP
jgi:intracellular sulfur oxidation DsrE/DsrF family protein